VPCAEEDQAAPETLDLDAVAQLGRGLARVAVRDELHADHQPESAHVGHAVVFRHQSSQPLLEVVPHGGGVGDEPAFEQLDGLQRGGDGDRVAAEGRGVRARLPVHQVGTSHTRPHRDARGDALRQRDDVRLEAVVVAREHPPRAPHARLHLVDDEEDPVLVADAAQAVEELARRGDVAALALHGLDDDGRDLVGRRRGLEEAALDPVEAGAADGLGVAGLAREGVPEDVGVGDVRDVERRALEAAPLRDLRGGEREGAERAAVEAVEEGDELLPPGRVHRQLERGLDGLGAAVGEVRPGGAGHGHDLFELAAEVRHVAVVVVGAAHVDEAGGLLLDGADDLRVAVAGGADGDAGVTVEEGVAVDVFDPDARGALDDELVGRARVGGRDVARVGRDDLLRAWAGQLGPDFGSFRGSYYGHVGSPPSEKKRGRSLRSARHGAGAAEGGRC